MQIKNPTSYAGVNYHSNDTAQSFSHPDFTVGSGISPDQLLHCVGLMLAIKSGVNYLDTAYIYPGSEVAVGEILHRNHCREEIRLATKLPQYYIKSGAAIEKYFNEQLTRLQTDYIDYYLMHMLTDVAAWEKLKKLGIEAWITQKKKEGKIRNI